MSTERTDDQTDASGSLLAQGLIAVVLIELALHRLAVPALRPLRDEPPAWHTVLSWVGNFFFYFAVALAIAVLVRSLGRLLKRQSRSGRPIVIAVAVGGAALMTMAVIAVLVPRSQQLTFSLDAIFTAALITVVFAQIPAGGDLGARIGIVLLALPLILHFYAPFALRFISGDDLGLPDRIQIFGQWSLVFSALAMPYCFAPRPFAQSAARLPPLIISMFVTVLAAVIIRRAAEVGMDLARDGFGVAVDPLAPVSMLALYIMALAAVTWTLVSCMTASSPARRQIGLGIGMILLGGYAFEWPLQYLLGFLGLLLVAQSARRVQSEETRRAVAPRGAPISVGHWKAFIEALASAITNERTGGTNPSVLTVNHDGDKGDEGDTTRTHIVWTENGADATSVRVRLSLVRRRGRLHYIDYLAGEEPEVGKAPSWTLWSRPPSQAPSAHPSPPSCPGVATRIGNQAFDARFQMRDAGKHAQALLPDEAMRERAAELLSGWFALWPDVALRHRLVPGVGSPLDRPIDPSAVASAPAAATVQLCEILALLGAMASGSVRGDQV